MVHRRTHNTHTHTHTWNGNTHVFTYVHFTIHQMGVSERLCMLNVLYLADY